MPTGIDGVETQLEIPPESFHRTPEMHRMLSFEDGLWDGQQARPTNSLNNAAAAHAEPTPEVKVAMREETKTEEETGEPKEVVDNSAEAPKEEAKEPSAPVPGTAKAQEPLPALDPCASGSEVALTAIVEPRADAADDGAAAKQKECGLK